MRLTAANVSNYRSVIDSTPFDIEKDKTILVGVNEAGKTAILKALRHINPPASVDPAADRVELDYLEDYPRRLLSNLQTGRVSKSDVEVVRATFALEPEDLAELPAGLAVSEDASVTFHRHLDNTLKYSVTGFPEEPTFSTLKADLTRLRAHVSKAPNADAVVSKLDELVDLDGAERVAGSAAVKLRDCLSLALPLVDEDNDRENNRWARLNDAASIAPLLKKAVQVLEDRLPLMVYYSTYFTVRPRIDLEALASRQASRDVDGEYDFGNLCLLKFLGFTARELSDMAKNAPTKPQNYEHDARARQAHDTAFEAYRRRLDDRSYRLNAAGVTLTEDIRQVWGDDTMKLKLTVDGQYLKVMVEDDLGVEVELDQRSEGFRWLVSFFVVFRAQAQDELAGAVLLLDEPGMSLHALKQQEFRKTVSLLGQDNQIVYTTHSPFMVGSDELDLVRIVEMADRRGGTKIHTHLQVDDPRSVYPLQAALGYELAQSMFSQRRNIVVEGVTDMFYLNAVNEAARSAGGPTLRHDPAIVPAGTASKVAYFCTIYSTQQLSVAALLDSDKAGDLAAQQDALVALLPRKAILRVGDMREVAPQGAETEDLFRETLTVVAKDLGWDSEETVAAQPTRPLMNILEKEHSGKKVSKWRLSKRFAEWLQVNGYDSLSDSEKVAWESLTRAMNKAL